MEQKIIQTVVAPSWKNRKQIKSTKQTKTVGKSRLENPNTVSRTQISGLV